VNVNTATVYSSRPFAYRLRFSSRGRLKTYLRCGVPQKLLGLHATIDHVLQLIGHGRARQAVSSVMDF